MNEVLFLVFYFFLFPTFLAGKKIRGVSLGGWLVLESWIRPSLFAQFENTPYEKTAIDEFSFNARLGPEEARHQLEKHWSEWVTEEDFQKIHEYGLTHVRIPFGWWIFGDSPEYAHNISHLDRALDLACKYKIKVLLNLHGAPGTQNGFDNSGIVCKSIQYGNNPATFTQENPEWDKYIKNLNITTKILKKIALRYRQHSAVWGLEFLNEPGYAIDLDLLKQWYIDTYKVLRHLVPKWQFLISESFRPYNWTGFMANHSEYYNIMLDTHIYLAYNETVIMTKDEDEILRHSCNQSEQVEFMLNYDLPIFFGEWSLAINDCAKYLNGFHTHSRTQDYGVGCNISLSKDFYKKLAKNQLYVFEKYKKSKGWIFWNFKTELEENEWSWFGMVKRGWVPHNAREIPEFIKDSHCIQISEKKPLST